MKIVDEAIIKAYEDGESMGSIARAFGTYATTVKRVLEKHNIELRHDNKRKGMTYVKDGEKLIEWAKSQGRLVTKTELAAVIGKRKLSPSYFTKYPELGQYVVTQNQKELNKYYSQLYSWLKEHNIPYKPNDRTKLGMSVDALLLGEYTGIALQIVEKPTYVSRKVHHSKSATRTERAEKAGIVVIYLDEELFKDLDSIKSLLDTLKH